MEILIKKMKQDYDSLHPVSEELYHLLSRHLIVRRYRKGDVIKPVYQEERASRYICRGHVGVYFEQSQGLALGYVGRETDTVFDMVSYSGELKSNIEIRAISEVVILEFPKENEQLVVKRYPDFAQLGILINHRIQERMSQQMTILRSPMLEGYPKFCQLFPGIEDLLHYQDWADLFATSTRTVGRVFTELAKGNHEQSST
ncbi:Crp/Fnr family transcriptional regulator [Algoriphagus lacus]|uniref:Crp/Fnr family transcriptional regulator n=1 Tax=Algoriphagus lacus TaxID=2056311 RepID=A0A418PMU1_9BACT|nr:Crp/Fnr family transcriptional regulator [Algoriphagus lacus]RIW13109.1 Crp/Fnr family transcriptional regulator [Algoriphagus lacus]